jgi:transcriptional regulator with XRE-family HTH domain
MKGADLKAFRKANNLTQTKLGEYLGINKSFISTIESGKDPMPKEKLSKLINNPYGWDTSMLTMESENVSYDPHMENLLSVYKRMYAGEDKTLIGYLQSQIEEKDALINELYKQLGKYEAMLSLERKGEIA